MKYAPNRFAIASLIVMFLLTSLFVSLPAQTTQKSVEEVEVPIIKKAASKHFRCYAENSVVDEEKFKKIIADKDCAAQIRMLDVDFAKQTLITFGVGGDCFIRAAAKVFRRDEAKTYKIRIKNIWGGCRAAGSIQGFLVVEKIPSDYRVEFVVERVDSRNYTEDEYFSLTALPTGKETITSQEKLETRAFEMKDCIQTYRQKKFVITDEETYLKSIRHDASRESCLKNLEKIDFKRYSLLGIEINSGYCRFPIGLQYQTIKDEINRHYLLNISYIDPGNAVCRALSQYDLWVTVPKLPAGYEVRFDVKAK